MGKHRYGFLLSVAGIMALCLSLHVPPLKAHNGKVTQAGSGRAVKAGPGTRQGLWQTFGVLDGLPSLSVLAILQDREGYLWFGTYGGGVSRYDGEQFVTFTKDNGLAHNDVRAIVEDREGDLWFGTWGGGVSRYDGEQFVTFTTEHGLAHNEVTSILEDREGRLWFGTYGGGVSRYDAHSSDGEQFATFTTENGLASNEVWAILEDRDGNLWFGTNGGGGVSRYDGEQFVTFVAENGLANDWVRAILEDRDGNLWFGTMGGGVSRYDPSASSGGTGEELVTFTTQDGLADSCVRVILEDQEGHLWLGTQQGGVSRYDVHGPDGEQFVPFNTQDGLAENNVWAVLEDREGHLWFGTYGGGVSRYDGELFVSFTMDDGLAGKEVWAVLEDREGHLWFGTYGGGVSRYDGEQLITLTTQDGLAHNLVTSILEDQEGYLWFGTMGRGVSRYDAHGPDGERFDTTFTMDDGLAHNNVLCIGEDRDGTLWFGTKGAGVSRYDAHRPDGEQFVTFTRDNGLAHNDVRAIVKDQEGNLWFGTWGGGVSRYDGEQFITFTRENGLASDFLLCVLADPDGNVWFGTMGGGVSRYDGEEFVTFNTDHGLAHNDVTSILQDQEGDFWFGTWGGGVSRYDGLVFQRLLKRDGLPDDAIQEIFQDRNGDIWIITQQGIIRYRSRHVPPRIRLTNVMVDRRTYDLSAKIRAPAFQKCMIAFDFQGSSLKTPWDRMAYVYRLEGYDEDWLPAYGPHVKYPDLPRGEYVFQVKAVDWDLAYSEAPAEVRVRIHLPYGRIALIGLSGMAMMAAVVASGYAVKRRRERDRARQALLETQAQLVEEMGKELQIAHDLQMGLMPDASPEIPGLDIAGRCLPANRVGGDYFDYVWMDEKHTNLCVVLADVAGKAMKAAIPVVRFSGMLHTALEHASSPAHLLSHLNRSLPPKLGPRSFICCCVAFLDVRSKRMILCNASQPGPLVRRGEHICTISMKGSRWPLGIFPEVHYEDVVFDLEEGDVVLFHTDGAMEAHNEVGELYGFDRLETVLCRGGSPEMDAEGWIEGILEEVRGFGGTAPQHDDMTLVVLKVGT